jgi:diaminopimelate epimerase
MKVQFTKMQGASNDFILVNELESEIIPREQKQAFAVFACNRRTGIGADEVIFIQSSENSDVKAVFFNPDGTQAEMDGNGIRCVGKFLHDNGVIDRTSLNVETQAGIKTLNLTLYNEKVEQVRVDMGVPQLTRHEIDLEGRPKDTFIGQDIEIDGKKVRITCVGTGNPHAIVFVQDIDNEDVLNVGRKIRRMSTIFHKGVNVHFVQIVRGNEFRIRTYERGVENETLASGTGACACAVAAVLNNLGDPERRFTFISAGGELNVELKLKGGTVVRMFLVGPTVEVYKGELEYDHTELFQKAAFAFIGRKQPGRQ